jgi:hypothetical protein
VSTTDHFATFSLQVKRSQQVVETRCAVASLSQLPSYPRLTAKANKYRLVFGPSKSRAPEENNTILFVLRLWPGEFLGPLFGHNSLCTFQVFNHILEIEYI